MASLFKFKDVGTKRLQCFDHQNLHIFLEVSMAVVWDRNTTLLPTVLVYHLRLNPAQVLMEFLYFKSLIIQNMANGTFCSRSTVKSDAVHISLYSFMGFN